MEIIRKSIEQLLKTIVCSRKRSLPPDDPDILSPDFVDSDISFEYCPTNCYECSSARKEYSA